MRFADKLFFAMTCLMTVIFTIFGIWIMTSFFQKLLARELEQGSVESQMFQYMFEMSYKAVPEEYGQEYALTRAAEDCMGNLNGEGSNYYIFDSSKQLVYGEWKAEEAALKEDMIRIQEQLEESKSYGCHVISQGDKHYLLSACRSENDDMLLYLSICKDITAIYEDRAVLLNQYRMVLALLLVVSTAMIFLLSQYMTRPIGELTQVARRIAGGDLTKRSDNQSQDEIGELSGSFNTMADALVERVKEKEQEAIQKAKEAKQQEDFTAAFAHELKTPLTSIIGYADMLGTIQMSDAERSEAAYYIFNQGKRLESLSHKLLELVSLEQTPLVKKPVNTKDLEDNIRNTMRPIFKQKQINGKIILEKDKIYTDKDLLLSLLYNILDNGSKAVSPGGFILLKGTVVKEGYEFKAVDNGRGIPEEEISRITEAFYMVDKSRSRKEGGAGIGMALCQKIVKLHGGTMQIDSRLGEGTVVRILLPGKERLGEAVGYDSRISLSPGKVISGGNTDRYDNRTSLSPGKEAP